MKRSFFFVLVSALVLVTSGCSRTDEPSDDQAGADEASMSDVGTSAVSGPLGQAPDFTLPAVEGDSLRLADFKGKVVVLNYWGTWCMPCIAEMPGLQALHEDLGSEGLVVIGVSFDDEGPDDVKHFARRLGIEYPLGIDDGSVADAYGGVWALPTTFVIDRDGKIAERVIGILQIEEMLPRFRELLDQPRASSSG